MERLKTSRAAPEPTSQLLHRFAHESDADPVSVSEIAKGLKDQTLGFTLLLFSLPCALPMPPGFPTLAGFVIVLISFHLITGIRTLWLPRWIGKRTISRENVRNLVERALPSIRWLERFCKPRFALFTQRLFRIVIGVTTLVMGIILILPIPILGNITPGLAVAVIALGLTARDGLLVLLGLILSAGAALFTWTMVWAAVKGVSYTF